MEVSVGAVGLTMASAFDELRYYFSTSLQLKTPLMLQTSQTSSESSV